MENASAVHRLEEHLGHVLVLRHDRLRVARPEPSGEGDKQRGSKRSASVLSMTGIAFKTIVAVWLDPNLRGWEIEKGSKCSASVLSMTGIALRLWLGRREISGCNIRKAS